MKRTIISIALTVVLIVCSISVSFITANAKGYRCSTPNISSAEANNNGIIISWKKVSNAQRYRVFRKNGNKWLSLGTTTSTNWTNKLGRNDSGKTFTYTVRCVSQDGKTFESDYNHNGISRRFFSAPNLSASVLKNGIRISWSVNTSTKAHPSMYHVFVKVNGKWRYLAETNKTVYIDSFGSKSLNFIKNNHTYTYTVRCVSQNGKTYESGYNNNGIKKVWTPPLSVSKTNNGNNLSFKFNKKGYYKIEKIEYTRWVFGDDSKTVSCISNANSYVEKNYGKNKKWCYYVYFQNETYRDVDNKNRTEYICIHI